MLILTKLFQDIIYTSIFASIIVFIILLFKYIFKNKLNANWHYYIWFIVILRLLIPSLPSSNISIFNLLNNSNLNTTFQSVNQEAANYNTNEVPTNSNDFNINKNEDNPKLNFSDNLLSKENLLSLFSVIWVIGSITTILIILLSYFRFLNKNKKSNHLNTTELNNLLNNCKVNLNIKSNVQVYYCNSVNTPTVLGFTKKTIIIPDFLMNKLSTIELKQIIYHELCHIKRRDIEINFLILFLQSIHWFNPILWFAFNKSKSDCEVACDNLVLKNLLPENIKSYGETIIKLASLTRPSKSMSLNLGIINKKNIKRRIIMVTKFKKKSIIATLSGCIIIGIISVICLTNPKVNNTLTSNIPADSVEADSVEKESTPTEENVDTPTVTPEENLAPVTTTKNISKPQEPVKPKNVPISEETIVNDKIIYKNNKYGIQLTMPLSWRDKYFIFSTDYGLELVYKFQYDWRYDQDTPDANKVPRIDSQKFRTVFSILNTNMIDQFIISHTDSFYNVPQFQTFHGIKYLIGGPTDCLNKNDPDRPGLELLQQDLQYVLNNIKEIDITYSEK